MNLVKRITRDYVVVHIRKNSDCYKNRNPPKKDVDAMMEAMKKYDTPWWESKNSKEVASYQIFEPVLLVPFPVLHEGTERLLEREVQSSEFAYMDALRQEAVRAM